MNFLVGLYLAFMLVNLLISWGALRKTTPATRWASYGLYALTAGLWVYFYMNTNHNHLATMLQSILNPLVPFGL